ncbi:hypothetical protein CYMTET_14536, partial [Cymbomonas tetramitiformis]
VKHAVYDDPVIDEDDDLVIDEEAPFEVKGARVENANGVLCYRPFLNPPLLGLKERHDVFLFVLEDEVGAVSEAQQKVISIIFDNDLPEAFSFDLTMQEGHGCLSTLRTNDVEHTALQPLLHMITELPKHGRLGGFEEACGVWCLVAPSPTWQGGELGSLAACGGEELGINGRGAEALEEARLRAGGALEDCFHFSFSISEEDDGVSAEG